MNLILGKNSFIGKSLYHYFGNKNLPIELISSAEFLYSNQDTYAKDNLILIDCVGVSRGEDNEFFEINFHQKVEIMNKLIDISRINNIKVKYIFFNSIHNNSNTLYGYSKLFTTFLMQKILSVNGILCLDITLCGMYGRGVVPHKYSVVGTFYKNLKDGLQSYINDDDPLIEISNVKSIFEIMEEIGLTNEVYNQNYLSYKIDGSKIHIKELYKIMKKIYDNNPIISEDDFYSILTMSLELANEK